MMNKHLIISVFLFFILGVGVVFGENTDESVKDDSFKFSGVFFAGYDQALNGNQDGRFSVTRLYLTLKKNLPGVFSFRVTLDAMPLTNPEKEGYEALVKYAYLQAAPKFGPLKLKFQGGMIGTPAIGLVNSLTGIRWIGNTYVGASKSILADGAGAPLSIDTAADLGVSLQAEMFDVVTVTGAFTNGEGYKNVDDGANSYDGKSYYATFSIIPLEGIYLNGFFRYIQEGANDDLYYYGGGAAWKGRTIRAGANFFNVTSDAATSERGFLAEGWVNVNFDSFIGAPLLLIGRAGLAHGLDKSDNSQYGTGLGYRFNKNVQTAIYYEYTQNFDGSEGHVLSCKLEVKI